MGVRMSGQNRHQRAGDRPPLSDAPATLQFARRNVRSAPQWKALLADLHGDADASASLHAVLEHLVCVMPPHELLQVLPSHGNADIFLPFLKRSYSGASASQK